MTNKELIQENKWMREKVIRDGKVAVLYSPGYGVGGIVTGKQIGRAHV